MKCVIISSRHNLIVFHAIPWPTASPRIYSASQKRAKSDFFLYMYSTHIAYTYVRNNIRHISVNRSLHKRRQSDENRFSFHSRDAMIFVLKVQRRKRQKKKVTTQQTGVIKWTRSVIHSYTRFIKTCNPNLASPLPLSSCQLLHIL